MRVDPTAFDVYYFAPQKCFASDGGLWLALLLAARDRAHRTHRAATRWMPPTLDLVDRARELPPRPDLQHARARHALPARRTRSEWMLAQRRARVRGRPVRRRRPRSSTAGPSARPCATPFVKDPALPQPGDRHHRLRRHRSTRRRSRRRCAPTASSTSSRTASSAATSCASRCSRRSSPTTSSTLTRAIDYVVDRLGSCTASGLRPRLRAMLLLHEVHTVAGRHEDEFEDAFRDGWMPTLAERRRRAPPLLPEARARHRSRVPHASRSPRCATAPRTSGSRRASSAATSASWAADVDRLRHEVEGKLLLPGRLVTDAGPRPRDGADRRPRARPGALHGRQRVAARRRSSTRTSRRRARTTRRASSSAPSARCSRCSACSRPRSARRAGAKSCCGSASTSPSGCPACSPRSCPRT